ncbi:MAG: polyprenyl synthetase family protein [Clostridiales bacterium]|nr:polyprenyl synthetase family protein [Clostridiales bacterium]
MTFLEELEVCRGQVEGALADYFQADVPQKYLLDAMRYSLLAGGKRIRAVLVLKFCEAAGGDANAAMPIACGVEMLHTYSLIHDDLPCMDNDDLRRGKPTNHKVYGEMTATLAGDALQAGAFEAVLSANLPAETRAECALTLAQAVGALGMCGGQQLDKEGESQAFSLNQVTYMNGLKTGCLLRAACEMGVLAAGLSKDSPQAEAARAYADAIGLAFQIRDDMLNVTSTEQAMGKPVGNDAALRKSTYVSLLGLEGCRERMTRLTAQAQGAIAPAFVHPAFLQELAGYLAERQK